MKDIAIRRLHVYPLIKDREYPLVKEKGGLHNELNNKTRLSLLASMVSYGFNIVNSNMLNQASIESFVSYKQDIEVLRSIRGGNDEFCVPLFLNFPDEIPEDMEYFAKRIIGFIGNTFDMFQDLPNGKVLSNGVVVPDWLFDLKQFGADPITQFQTKELFEQGKTDQKNRKKDDYVEWINIELIWTDNMFSRLRDWLRKVIYSKSSIKEAWHEDIYELLQFFGGDVLESEKIVSKENKALVCKVLWKQENYNSVIRLCKTPTDVLRMFAALTDGDISLAGNIKFPKLSRPQRKAILQILESSPNLLEDLYRYRNLWVRIAKGLHANNTFPKAYGVIQVLRNEHRYRGFNSVVESCILEKDYSKLISVLKRKPGIFARKLHEVLRKFPEESAKTLDHFDSISSKVPLKTLITLYSYFKSIDTQEYRTVINKRGKMLVVPNTTQPKILTITHQSYLVAGIIKKSIIRNISERDDSSWADKKVYIDPELHKIIVPLYQRKGSEGVYFEKGSWIKIKKDQQDKVLRLFVYWKQQTKRTDLDLSVVFFDDNFRTLGHVSYTRLQSLGAVHSGDLQSAPSGAAEFIDIPIANLHKKIRYVVPEVYRYAGDNFDIMDTCYAGYMFRNNVNKKYSTFDSKTVALKFDLNGKGNYCIPILVDVKDMYVVVSDLFVGKGNRRLVNVEGSVNDVSLLSEQISRFYRTRPNMYDLLYFHTIARGGQEVYTAEEADLVFDASLNIPSVLSEFL